MESTKEEVDKVVKMMLADLKDNEREIIDRGNVAVNETRSFSKCTILKSDISSIRKKATSTKNHLYNKTQGQLSLKVPEITTSEMFQHEGTFQYMVNKVITLDCAICFEAIFFRDLLWRIFVMPINDSKNDRTLGVFLHCCRTSRSSSWSCDVAVEFRLLSFKNDQEPYVRNVRHLFCSEAYNWGFQNFILWNDIVNPDNSYIENDCIILEVNIVDFPQQNNF